MSKVRKEGNNTINTKEDQSYDLHFNPWLFWAAAAIFYLYQFALRVSPCALNDPIMCELSLDASGISAIMSPYYLAYAIMQVPAGLIYDRFGPKSPLVAACITAAIGCFMFIQADSTLMMSSGRFLMGVGSAFGFLGCVKIASMFFGQRQIPLLIGVSLFMGTIGAMGATNPLQYFVSSYGWVATMTGLGVFAIILGLIIQLSIKFEYKSNQSGMSFTETAKNAAINTWEVISNIKIMRIGLFGFSMYSVLSGFADMWAEKFFKVFYDYELAGNNSVTAFYLGLGIGAVLNSATADLFKSYTKPMTFGAFISAILAYMVIYNPPSSLMFMYIVMFSLGFAASVQLLAYTSVTHLASSRLSGTANGVYNSICMISGYVFQPLIGNLMDKSGAYTLAESGTKIYSIEAFYSSLWIIPFMMGVGVIGSFLVKDTYKKTKDIKA